MTASTSSSAGPPCWPGPCGAVPMASPTAPGPDMAGPTPNGSEDATRAAVPAPPAAAWRAAPSRLLARPDAADAGGAEPCLASPPSAALPLCRACCCQGAKPAGERRMSDWAAAQPASTPRSAALPVRASRCCATSTGRAAPDSAERRMALPVNRAGSGECACTTNRQKSCGQGARQGRGWASRRGGEAGRAAAPGRHPRTRQGKLLASPAFPRSGRPRGFHPFRPRIDACISMHCRRTASAMPTEAPPPSWAYAPTHHHHHSNPKPHPPATTTTTNAHTHTNPSPHFQSPGPGQPRPCGRTFARFPLRSTLHSSSVPLSAISRRCTSSSGPAAVRSEARQGNRQTSKPSGPHMQGWRTEQCVGARGSRLAAHKDGSAHRTAML